MRRPRPKSAAPSRPTSSHSALFTALFSKIQSALPRSGVTEAGKAPLAVVGAAPRSGLFAFDKFSRASFHHRCDPQ
jgi:hypothetical protein